VLGGDSDGVAKAERECFVERLFAFSAFAFIGDRNNRLAGVPCDAGEHLVGAGDAVAGVDDKQDEVGCFECGFALCPHTGLDRAFWRFFEASCIDELERVPTHLGLALSAIARQAWEIGDKGVSCIRQTVIQG
jgi:hypothetical protein